MRIASYGTLSLSDRITAYFGSQDHRSIETIAIYTWRCTECGALKTEEFSDDLLMQVHFDFTRAGGRPRVALLRMVRFELLNDLNELSEGSSDAA